MTALPAADTVGRVIERMERHQIAVYLLSMALGAVIGFSAPRTGPVLEHAINPALGALLYVTFLQVPARDLARSLRDGRFLAAILTVNFVVVPLVVAVLFAFLPTQEAISVGVLLVLLCPCVDYVIVFTGLADGDNRRLLSATPLLLLLQMALLPLYLTLFLGDDLREIVDVGPFLRAFVFLIVIPLALAWLTQAWSARTRAGQRVATGAGALMVPLMAVVLAVVVASQIPRIDGNLGALAPVIVVYAAFLVVMPLAGKAVAGLLRLDVPASRAVAFSGATRNSLVVLPLALALPTGYELAAAAVVAQTLVEMVGMVVYVRAIPRLVR